MVFVFGEDFKFLASLFLELCDYITKIDLRKTLCTTHLTISTQFFGNFYLKTPEEYDHLKKDIKRIHRQNCVQKKTAL